MKEAPSAIFTDSEGEEVDVNKVDAALRSVGISLKDANGQFRDLDDVFLDLAKKWDTLDTMQQRYVATQAAGSRQQSRFIAMLSDYDRTMELVSAANSAAGASQLQYEKTLESFETKLNKLKNAWDTFILGIADSSLIKIGIDLLTKVLDVINSLTDALPDGISGFAKLGVAILSLKAGKALLEKGFSAIFTSFIAKTSLQAEIGGEQVGIQFVKGVNKGASEGNLFSRIFSGVKGQGLIGGTKQLGSNISSGIKNWAYPASISEETATNLFSGAITKKNEGKMDVGAWQGLQAGMEKMGASADDAKKFASGIQEGTINTENFSASAKEFSESTRTASSGLQSLTATATVAAAVMVALAVADLYDNWVTTSSEKIASLNEALDEVNAKISENQEILDNYETTKNDYDDLVTSLSQLAEGSAEWSQNLLKVNQQTQEILSKYPELTEYTKEINGVRTLTDEGWEAYQSKVIESQQTQYSIQASLNSQLIEAQNTKNLEDLTYTSGGTEKNISTATTTSSEQSATKTAATVVGIAAGVIAGLFTGGLGGILVGAVVAGAAGLVTEGIGAAINSIGITESDAKTVANTAAETGFVAEGATETQIKNFIAECEDAGAALGDLKDVILEDGAAFDEWVNENVASNLQAESQRDALISNLIDQNATVRDSDTVEQVRRAADLGFDDYNERFADALKEAEDLGEDQLKSQYAELNDLTSDEVEAKLESKELSEETMQQAIAAKSVSDNLVSIMKDLTNSFTILNEKIKSENKEERKQALFINHLISENGANLTTADLEDFGDVSELDKDDLEGKLDDILSQWGLAVESLEVNAEILLKNLQAANNTQDNFEDNYGKDTVTAVDKLQKNGLLGGSNSGLSIGAKESLLKAYTSSGADQKGLSAVFEKIFDRGEITDENVDTVNGLIAATDFTDSKDVKTFLDSLEDCGVTARKFENDLIKAANATHTWTTEEIRTQKAAQTSAEDLLYGREASNVTFTEEEYTKLTNAGADPDKFTQIGDDWVYIGGTTNDLLSEIWATTRDIHEDMPGVDGDGKDTGEGNTPADLNKKIVEADAKIKIAEAPAEKRKELQKKKEGSYLDYDITDFFKTDEQWKQYAKEAGIADYYSNQTIDELVDNGDWTIIRDHVIEDLTKNLSNVQLSRIYGLSEGGKKDKDAAREAMLEALEMNGASKEGMRRYRNYSYKELKKAYNENVFTEEHRKEVAEQENEMKTADYWQTLDSEELVQQAQYYNDEAAKADEGSDDQKFNEDVAQAISDALVAQAAQYGVTQKAIEKYNEAISDGSDEQKAEARAILAANIAAQKQKKAIDASASSLKTYIEALDDNEKGSDEYQKAIEGIATIMNNIMGTKVDYDFFEDSNNLQDFLDLLNGVPGAWEKVRTKMLGGSLGDSDYLANNLGLDNVAINKIQENKEDIQNALNNLDFKTDGSVDLTGLYQTLNKLTIGKENIDKILANWGFTYTVETKDYTNSSTNSLLAANEIVTAVKGQVQTNDMSGYFRSKVNDDKDTDTGGSSTTQKNTKKTWHYNRDIAQEKREQKTAKLENQINKELTKEIPNLEKIYKLRTQNLKSLQAQVKASKANQKAAEKELNSLWKQAKKKGYNKLLNKDGTVNLKAYNSKTWSDDDAKAAFDEWESNLEDTLEYLQTQKENTQELQLQIAEIKNARSEYTLLTNLAEKHEVLAKKITALQSQYTRELNKTNSSGSTLVSNLILQEKSLQNQLTLQKQIQKQNQKQAKKYMNKSKSSKYFKSIDYSTGAYEVDYAKINKAIKKGADADEIDTIIKDAIEYLDGISEAAEEQNSLLDSINDNIQDRLSNVTDLQSKVREAIVQSRQDTIDSLSEIDSSIQDTNSKILNAVQDNISKLREDRKNEETEQDLADKETRLAYLRQYSGTGNAAEIAKLEDEIANDQESYTDTLIDQKISELQDQNDKASEERQRQIKILERQLEVDQQNGKITAEVSKVLSEGIVQGQIKTTSALYALLAKSDDYYNMTSEEQQQWWDEMEGFAAKYSTYQILDNKGGITNSQVKSKDFTLKNTNVNGTTSSYGIGSSFNGGTITNLSSSQDGYVTVTTQSKNGKITTTSKTTYMADSEGYYYPDTASSTSTTKTVAGAKEKDFVRISAAVANKHNAYGWNGHEGVFQVASINASTGKIKLYKSSGNKTQTFTVDNSAILGTAKKSSVSNLLYKKDDDMNYKFLEGLGLLKKGKNDKTYSNVSAAELKKLTDKKFVYSGQANDGGRLFKRKGYPNGTTYKTKKKNPTKIQQFKTGGIADFTGPAWLDGTKTKPEIILNQKDTENFIQLKDILASVMRGTNTINTQSNGDTRYEVNITVEKLTSDYDVDKVAKRVKKLINDSGKYRTVNQVRR